MSMPHPIQSVIESLFAAERCPRLHVNSIHKDVVIPDFVQEQWKEQLVIDLDTSYPLDLSFDERGVEADLSFGGYVTRCVFPWAAIYIVADRETGYGSVIEQNIPESVRKKRNEQAKQRAKKGELMEDLPDDSKKKPEGLSLALAADSNESDEAPEDAPQDAPNDASEDAQSEAQADSTPENEVKEESVKARRAAFRVIDGGD